MLIARLPGEALEARAEPIITALAVAMATLWAIGHLATLALPAWEAGTVALPTRGARSQQHLVKRRGKEAGAPMVSSTPSTSDLVLGVISGPGALRATFVPV